MAEKEPRPVEVLPALDANYTSDEFTPVSIDDDDRAVTIIDLQHINTLMACAHQALPCVRTIKGLESLVNMNTKLIEVRRNVLKLPYGASKSVQRQGRMIEVLE